MILRHSTVFMLAISPLILAAQRAIPDLPPRPGKGMAQHPFLYCGEWQRRSIADQTMYIANGNTLINNWVGSVPQEEWPKVVQLIEVTPDKKVVWALRDWTTLGPASSTQLLNEPGAAGRELQR